MKWTLRLLLVPLNQLIPLPGCFMQDWRIRRRIRKHADDALDADSRPYLAVRIDALKESHRAALAMRDQLQRRAQGYLMAVTVATSFCFGVVGLLSKGTSNPATAPNHHAWEMRIALFAVLGSFFMSALSALSVLGPSRLYDLWLRSRLPTDEEQEKTNLIRFIKLNEAYAMAYECQLRGSYVTMRNGVVLLFVVLVMAVAHSGLIW